MSTDAPIEFWFDFASPYAWLASARIEGVGTRCGRAVVWRPMLLGVVFRETGMTPLADQPMRSTYARHDVARLAHRFGLPFATVFAPPGTSLTLGRIFYAIAAASPAKPSKPASGAARTCRRSRRRALSRGAWAMWRRMRRRRRKASRRAPRCAKRRRRRSAAASSARPSSWWVTSPSGVRTGSRCWKVGSAGNERVAGAAADR